MSDETESKLAEAQRVAAELRATANREIAECLNVVATELPGRLDDIAKRTAQSQPEVTKSLGSDGLKAFRAELAEGAEQLANDLRSASDKIKWPEAESDYVRLDSRKIHSALFEYLYGPRVDRLASVFKRHGFDIHDRDGHSQSLILPQSLYREKDFESVAEALNAAGAADRAATSAKAADDEDIVASLWEDSESGE